MNSVVFIDSGVGGVAYLQAVRPVLAHSYIYVADTLHFPYGARDAGYVLNALRRLMESIIHACTPALVIIACNTASVICLEQLRKDFSPLPFIGTVPAVKPAGSTDSKRIVLLSSTQTAADQYTKDLISKYARTSTILSMPEDALIREIEISFPDLESPSLLETFEECITAIRKSGGDSLVLACTHFLHLRSWFESELPNITIFDSVAGIARRLQALLTPLSSTKTQLYTSSQSNRYRYIAEKLQMEYCGVLHTRNNYSGV